jgi:hypothetical protein
MKSVDPKGAKRGRRFPKWRITSDGVRSQFAAASSQAARLFTVNPMRRRSADRVTMSDTEVMRLWARKTR